MQRKNKSLVFFGSGPVAVKSLELLKKSFNVNIVVTKPTTIREMSTVAGNSKLFSASSKAELDELFTTKNLGNDLAILIDFGIILSNKIIKKFSKGIINSHFSLLPELRGADPISFAILRGKAKTGVSLMLLVEAMDEGPILTSGDLIINHNETAPSLTKKLIHLSNKLLTTTIPSYLAGKIKPESQEDIASRSNTKPSYTCKLSKKDGIIQWDKSALQIERELRAFQDWPKSTTKLGDIDVIITKASVNNTNPKGQKATGSLEVSDNNISVQCGKGRLIIRELKPLGKRNMPIKAFLTGYRSRLNK